MGREGLAVARLLLIVSRAEPARYTYLKHVFGSDAVEVIVDRRAAAPRSDGLEVPVDPPHADRRQHHIKKDLEAFGWALVRR